MQEQRSGSSARLLGIVGAVSYSYETVMIITTADVGELDRIYFS